MLGYDYEIIYKKDEEKVVVNSGGKHPHLKMVEAKWNFMPKQADDFATLFKPLVQRGLPFFWEEKGPMLSHKEYYDRLVECKKEHGKFEDMAQQSISGKTVVKKLSHEFELLFDFKSLCTRLTTPSYLENLELEVLVEEMVKLEIPTSNQWKVIENCSKSEHRLHQG